MWIGLWLWSIPELAILVFVDDPAQRPLSRVAVSRALFRLSPAEARLADLLAAGLDLNAVAEQMRLTQETARFQLKRVLAKTGTHRQTELMLLMLTLPGQDSSLVLSPRAPR